MPEMTQQRIGELLRKVFELLWFEPDGLYAREIFDYLRKFTELTDFERGPFPVSPSLARFEVLLRVATIPLMKAGWLVKTTKGRWYITDLGRKASKQYSKAEDFFEEAMHQYREWKRKEEERLLNINSLERFEAEENSWSQIKNFIQGMSLAEFRSLTSNLLKAMGYYIAWEAPPQKDRGQVDIIAYTDPLGAKGPRIIIHVSHIGQVITQEGFKTIISALKPDDCGLIVSTSGFTNQVKEEALFHHQPSIRLIDLESFVELWIKYADQLSIDARHSFPLKAVYFLSLPDPSLRYGQSTGSNLRSAGEPRIEEKTGWQLFADSFE